MNFKIKRFKKIFWWSIGLIMTGICIYIYYIISLITE